MATEVLQRLTDQGDGTSVHEFFTASPLALQTTQSLGTVGSGVTAVEWGDRYHHTTVLTLSTTLPAIAGGANLAVGKLIYTFPAGDVIVEACSMNVTLTAADGNIDADTPDVGIGTVIGSGAVAVLGGTATFENIITGQTATDCSGTNIPAVLGPTAGGPLGIADAAAHTVHLNVADGWAASGETACPLAGTVVLRWSWLGDNI